MANISAACRILYNEIKKEYPNTPTIADNEWSKTNHDLDLFNRFMERWDLIKKKKKKEELKCSVCGTTEMVGYMEFYKKYFCLSCIPGE